MSAWSGRMKTCKDTSGHTLAIHRCCYQMFASKSKALSPRPCGTHALSQRRSHEPPLAPAAADQTAQSGLQTDQGCQHACPVLPGHLWCQPGRGYKNLLGTQFSRSVVSDSLQPHGLQHARPPCPSPTPRVYSNPCPWSRWCHPTISSSVILFSSHLQSFPASESFPMSQLFAAGGQTLGVSASTSILPMNTQDWSPLGWTGWISLQSKGFSRVFSHTTVQKHQVFGTQLSL